MKVLVDTNILVRMIQFGHPMHANASGSLGAMLTRGDEIYVACQSLCEYLVVATRPLSSNGLGLNSALAVADVRRLTAGFTVLYETERSLIELQRLVGLHNVSGKPIHDARLASVMLVSGVDHLLTFNTGDFKRYDGIRVLDPAAVVAGVQG